ncbi:MAG: NUDIX domain-containing protein [Proteobacteria bacterium]|nr:NUDIX domain-containing protein [Pseudomonadota bacterium]
MMTDTALAPIHIAAAVLMRADGQTLLVRKRGTDAFMQPGGKIGPGETALAALLRELHEELGLTVPVDQPRYLGRFTAPAAHEPGFMVAADLFRVETSETPEAAAEIAEIIWVDPARIADLTLAPLTRDLCATMASCTADEAWATSDHGTIVPARTPRQSAAPSPPLASSRSPAPSVSAGYRPPRG